MMFCHKILIPSSASLTGKLVGTDLLLRVPVHVHVQHQPGEGGPEVVRQLVILHTPGLDSFEWGAIKNMIIVLPEYQVRVKVL